MQTPAQITTNLKANLADPRMHAACLFLQDLIERKKPEVDVPRYRIYKMPANTPITTVDEFITAIDAATLIQQYPYQGERVSGDRVTGYDLVPNNLEVRFHFDSVEDDFYACWPQSKGRVCFYMAYMNDNDPVLALKISSLRVLYQS